jgi:S-adenosylmethionine-diacylgycerolhomoserine-N-methlytransferase
MEADTRIKDQMDRMYRLTRHIYDLSRKYYLLGRDQLIRGLDLKIGDSLCEVGCGTSRNLIKIADTWPGVSLYGIDASDEMLKTARQSLTLRHLDQRITLAQAYAQNFDPLELFGSNTPYDHILFSYSLSMIPTWQESVDHALTLLKIGGKIHIVDFGDQSGLPKWFARLLKRWLDMFHVQDRPQLRDYLMELGKSGKAEVSIRYLYGRYAWIGTVKKT